MSRGATLKDGTTDAADLLATHPATFRIPLPPAGTNHGYMPGVRRDENGIIHGTIIKTRDAKAWDNGARLIVGSWHPPEHTPLAVTITLELPRRLLWKVDIDSLVKFLTDVVVGPRCDQWIVDEHTRKVEGDGWAEITVRVDSQ